MCQSRPLTGKGRVPGKAYRRRGGCGKGCFRAGGVRRTGPGQAHRRLSRGEVEGFFAQAPRSQVRPYVTRNKTDRADAKGILKAYRNSDLRPVPVKSVSSSFWDPSIDSAWGGLARARLRRRPKIRLQSESCFDVRGDRPQPGLN